MAWPLYICLRREIGQVITAAKSGTGDSGSAGSSALNSGSDTGWI
jgi:hypothetical protein